MSSLCACSLPGWRLEESIALCLRAASGMSVFRGLRRGYASPLSSSHRGFRLTMAETLWVVNRKAGGTNGALQAGMLEKIINNRGKIM